METVDLPSPAGVGVRAVTRMRAPRGAGVRREWLPFGAGAAWVSERRAEAAIGRAVMVREASSAVLARDSLALYLP